MSRWWIAVAGLLVLGACGRSKPGSSTWSGPGPKHVALIVLDTLRADHLGMYGYARPTSPKLDALARDGAVFDNAFATSPCTLESVISLFTGTAPMANPNALPALEPVQGQFRRAGFATHAVVANPWLLSRPGLFKAGFDEHWNATQWGPNSTEAVADMARKQIVKSARDGRRSFFYFHFLDPHDPYQAPQRVGFYKGPPISRPLFLHAIAGEEQVKHRFKTGGFRGMPTTAALSPDELQYLQAEYDEEIRHLDQHLARVLDAFREHDMLEDTLVVITSDHGEAFMEHGLLKHGFQLYDELVRVPLLIHWPKGVRPGRRTGLASGVDIPTTLMKAVGFKVPSQFRGVDLLGDGRKAPVPLRTHFVNQDQVGFRSLRHKWIHNRATGVVELYDLAADPDERAMIRDSETLAAQNAVWRAVAARHSLGVAGPTAPAAPVDDQVKKQLEALGYLVE